MTAIERVRAFCFPGGEQAARTIRAVRNSQRGEMWSAPGLRAAPFTAEETTDATVSSFRWDARMGAGSVSSVVVTDAYEDGKGRIAVKLGGIVPVRKVSGPDTDKGELQRYLASFSFCPPMLLNNPSLEWTATGPDTLRVRDKTDPAGAFVDFEIGAEGRPAIVRAERPRIAGKRTVLTPWHGACGEFREWEGLRVATHL